MKLISTHIKDIKLISPNIIKDQRGSFFESYQYEKYIPYIGDIKFLQDNESVSKHGVLRGLHYQKAPFQQSKLIRVVKGKIQDVAVDIRPESSTYKKYVSVELDEKNRYELFIPHGFAHGFLVLSNEAVVSYKVDNYYKKDLDSGYKYDDPSFRINWNLNDKDIILSDKDKSLPYIK
tara:strand:+ start:22 stop:552 length:531 start_codon:yes stop_codon:yes gene_type:complete